MVAHGKIISVIDNLGRGKAKHRWGREVFWNTDYIQKRTQALLHYYREDGVIATTITSTVEHIDENSHTLTIYTTNSVYTIQKDGEE